MELEKAKAIAAGIEDKLRPYCSQIAIAGSIRRNKSWVNDLDIVAIPSNQGRFLYTLQQLGRIKMGGGKIIRVDMKATHGIDLDMYVATPETWATLLLIRTGSMNFNRKLCTIALQKGLKLKADGTGLLKGTEIIASKTETEIFTALGLNYLPPQERE